MIDKFNTDLFDCLKPPKLAAFSKPGENGKKKSQDELDGTELFIHNKNQKAAWKLKPDEKYGAVFHKKQIKGPKDDNKLICMWFLIKGSFTKGCNHLQKLFLEGEKLFDKFMRDCQGGAFSKKKRSQSFQGGAVKK